ncbi:MAG: tetratricopeptide repeat protein [Chloroflexia bacterium]
MDDFRREAAEHYERAVALERAGRIDEALIEYRRAADTDPTFAAAYEALGYHYQRRGLLAKALDAFQTVARLEGTYTAYFNLGYILIEMERYPEAMEAFRHCLELSPEDPAALYELGYACYAMGRPAEALETLRIPLQAYAQDARVHNLAGACYLDLEMWPEAEAAYRRALELARPGEEAEDARAGLLVARRYQEFPSGSSLSLRDQLYADAGVVLLGTAGDTGRDLSSWETPPLSPEHLATTLHRLQALLPALQVCPSAVVAVDRASIPLATVLSEMLTQPRKALSQLQPQERPLLVLLLGRQRELLEVALEQSPQEALSFVYALGWSPQESPLPDFIGVLVHGRMPEEIPWDEGALRSACARLQGGVEPEQIQYYLEHRRLRFLEETVSL